LALTIDYLLKNELSYLNAAWQFEAIRICELAKAKLKQVSDQLDVYSFKDITAIEKDSDIKINKEKSLLIIADYEKTVKKYSKLKAETRFEKKTSDMNAAFAWLTFS
jgi:hypothetical protein